jgi:hypothetical protein
MHIASAGGAQRTTAIPCAWAGNTVVGAEGATRHVQLTTAVNVEAAAPTITRPVRAMAVATTVEGGLKPKLMLN